MNINKVILASNENKDYLEFWPLVSEAWERIGVEPVLIYTGNDEINLNGHIINFYIKGIDSTFVAQNIRLLAPALFKDENCIISDIDSLPLSSKYFQNSVRDIPDDKFVIYRPDAAAENMIPICWNLSKGINWSEIFNVRNSNEIRNKLIYWYFYFYYLKNYKWYTDQIVLKKYLKNFKKNKAEKIVYLNDADTSFKRFDRVSIDDDLLKLEKYNEIFSEFHMPRPYREHRELIHRVYEKSILNDED